MNSPKTSKYFSPINILYFIAGIFLLGLLLLQVDFKNLVSLILNIPPGLLILGLLIYLCKALVRGFRFWRINAPSRPGYLKMLRLSLASSLASQLLPLKMGELTYVYAVKKDFQTSISQGLSSLIIVRIFDLLAISLLFVLAALLNVLPGSLSIYFNYVVAFIGFLLLCLLALVFAGRFFTAISGRLLAHRWLKKYALLHKLQKAGEDLLVDLGKYRGKQYLELIGYPLLEWGINFAMYFVLLRGIGLSPHLLDPVVAVTFAALASLLPISSFGSFGTQEAGWATGLILLGYSQDSALTSAFATHLLALGYMLILGGAAWLSYFAGAGATAQAEQPPADLKG